MNNNKKSLATFLSVHPCFHQKFSLGNLYMLIKMMRTGYYVNETDQLLLNFSHNPKFSCLNYQPVNQ